MIEKFTKNLLNKIVVEVNKDDNKYIINKQILTPILTSFSNKIYPYVSLLFIMYIINLIIIIIILILIITK